MRPRTFPKMGKTLRLVVAFVIAIMFAASISACGGSSSSEATTLNVLTWETYHDKAWLDAFTKDTGIKVNAVNVGSADEMFAKIKANPNQFDLALVTVRLVRQLRERRVARADRHQQGDRGAESRFRLEERRLLRWQTVRRALQLGRSAAGVAARLHPQHPRDGEVPR